jgi:gliding motility-associated-like protein
VTILINNVFGYGQVPPGPVCAESIEKYGVSGYPTSEYTWFVEGGTVIDGDGTDTVTIQWGYNTGEFQIEVFETTSENCISVPSVATIVVRAPHVDLGYDLPEICEGDSMVFDAGSQYQQPYEILWHNGSNAQEFIAKNTGEIWVRVIDGFGCTRYDSVNLTVNHLPVVNLGKDTILCDVETPMRLYAVDVMEHPEEFANAEWTLGGSMSQNPYFDVFPSQNRLDTLLVIIMNIKGCRDSDTLLVLPCDLEKLFVNMPNTITPNGDGVNDVWNIAHIEFFKSAILEIFDRWGTENVWEQPWDGKSKGKLLPMDSYYFVLELNYGNIEPITGTVNLIR